MADTTRTVKAKFDGDTTGLARAAKRGEQEIDRFTKNVDKKYRKSGDDSSKSFTSRFGAGIKKWFAGEGDGLFTEIGKSGGTVFGSGLLGALKTPILGPLIVGVVGATVATVMPAVGAIAGTGLVAGFGLGLAGLGLTFAAKSDKVKKAWEKTLDGMSDDLTLLSRPFEDTLVKMSGFAQRTFDRFAPELGEAFKELAPEVTGFADDATKAFERLAPVIQPVADAASNVLRTLGPALDSALDNTAQGLAAVAESVKENPDALADMVKGIGDLTGVLLDGIATLNNINGQIESLTGGISGVDLVFGGLKGAVVAALGPFSALESGLEAVGVKADKMTESVEISAETAKLWTQGLDQSQLAAMGLGRATSDTSTKVETLTTKVERNKRDLDKLIDSTFKYQNLALGLAGATINYQAALDAANASQKENGRTLNDNTAKGRANHQSLLDLAQAANAQTQSMLESSKGIGAASASAKTAQANFSTMAQKMGLSKADADKLAQSLIGIPKDTKPKVAVSGATAAKGQVDALGRSITNLPSVKNVTIRYTEKGVNLTTPSSVGRRASGGPTQPKRQYLFGERGPEIGEFPTLLGPPKIKSAEATRAELNRSDQPIVAEIHIEIGGEVQRVVRTEIKQNNRELKRSVQMAGAAR